jgi:RNA recognition motif-containing protein
MTFPTIPASTRSFDSFKTKSPLPHSPPSPPSLAYSKSLLLRKVPRRSSENDIQTVFETFGPVRDVYIPKNFETGKRETFAFIEFIELRDAIKAFSFLQENEMLLEGIILRADFARNGRRSPVDMGVRSSADVELPMISLSA